MKELRGTESTRKSIQKLKRDDAAEQERSGKVNRMKPALVCLAISHLGVEFIDVNSKVSQNKYILSNN